jgi:hypothetical protein
MSVHGLPRLRHLSLIDKKADLKLFQACFSYAIQFS